MIFLNFKIINHIISQGSASVMNRILKLQIKLLLSLHEHSLYLFIHWGNARLSILNIPWKLYINISKEYENERSCEVRADLSEY